HMMDECSILRRTATTSLLALTFWIAPVRAQPSTRPGEQEIADAQRVPTEQQSRLLRRSTDRGLTWLATQQQPDGSFRCDDRGQPAVTSLAVLAFLSCGYQPRCGAHSQVLDRAVR